jgi:formylglycine-generating enzyme required for sulfatase activity
VEIPAGSFKMGRADGSPEEGPGHEVDVPAFSIEILK